jgi:hypothetical protein
MKWDPIFTHASSNQNSSWRRSVVSGYTMVTVPEKSAEIASKIQAVVVDKLKGRHLAHPKRCAG